MKIILTNYQAPGETIHNQGYDTRTGATVQELKDVATTILGSTQADTDTAISALLTAGYQIKLEPELVGQTF